MNVFELMATISLKADEFNKGLQDAKGKIDAFGSEIGGKAQEIGSKFSQNIAPKFQEVGTKMQEVGTKMSNVGRTIAPVSAAFTAVGVAGVRSFAEFDKTMTLSNKTMEQANKIAGIDSVEAANKMNSAIKEAAANSTFGMNDAAQASLNFARAGLNAQQAADTLAPAMNLAAGEGGNLDTVSQGLVGTINGFGDTFDNAEKYADVFANACNNSALDVDGLSDSMSVAAPIFSTLGYSINDAALYMGTMANNGIDASVSANSLKTGMARLVDPAKAGAAWMEKLGINVTNADGTMKDSVTVQKELHDAFSTLSESEQAAAASAIFGKNQMAPWLALINTAPEDVSKLSDSLEKEGTTAEMAEAMMSGFGGSLEKLKSSADVAATSIGEALAPTISALADGIQKAVDWFNGLSESQQQVIATIGLVVAAAAPLLIIGGKVIAGLGLIITNIPVILGGLGAFGGFITATLIPALGTAAAAVGAFIVAFLPFIAIAAAVVAAGVLIYKNWDKIKETAGKVKDAVVQKWGELKENVSQKFEEIRTAAAEKWEAIKSTVAEKAGGIKQAVDEKIATVKEGVGKKWDEIKASAGEKWASIKETIGGKLNDIATNTKGKLDAIKQAYDSHGGGVKGTVAAYLEAINQKYSAIYNAINTLTGGKFGEIAGTIRTKMQEASKTVSDKLAEIKKTFTGLASQALQWGKDLIDKFVSGIKSKIGAVTSAINNVANKVKKVIHFSEPDEGPLSDFHTYAPDMMELFAKGIKDNAKMVQNTVKDAFNFQEPEIVPRTDYSPNLALAGSGVMQSSGGYSATDSNFENAVIDALSGLSVTVNIGQERLEGIVNQVIQKRNYKSGGR